MKKLHLLFMPPKLKGKDLWIWECLGIWKFLFKHFCVVFLGDSKNDPSCVVHFVELGTNLEWFLRLRAKLFVHHSNSLWKLGAKLMSNYNINVIFATIQIAYFTLKSMELQTLPHTWLSNNLFILNFSFQFSKIFLKIQYFPWQFFFNLKNFFFENFNFKK